MHKAPTVYVPTEPEGNGLTLPTLLSLLAHGLVIGILIYTYQNMDIETAGSIETTMVSPEQLDCRVLKFVSRKYSHQPETSVTHAEPRYCQLHSRAMPLP